MFDGLRRRWKARRATNAIVEKFSPTVAAIVGTFYNETRREPVRFIKEIAKFAYSNPAIAFAVDSIASDASELPLMVSIGNRPAKPLKEVDDERLTALKNQFGLNTRHNTEGYILRDYLLFGHAYEEAAGRNAALDKLPQGEIIISFSRIPTCYITPLWGQFGLPKSYDIKRYAAASNIPADPLTGFGRILFWQAYHPTEIQQAVAAAQKAYREVNASDSIAEVNYNLAERGAKPSGILSAEDGNTITGDALSKLKTEFDERFAGSHNAGKIITLNKAFKFTQTQITSREGEFLQTRDAMLRDILAQYKIPPQMYGLPDAATYSNLTEARRSYYLRAVLPIANEYWTLKSRWLSKWYGDDIVIMPDKMQVPSIAAEQIDRMFAVDRISFMTPNEKRARFDLPKVEGGDDLLVPAELTTIADIVNPPDIPPEGDAPDDNPPPAK